MAHADNRNAALRSQQIEHNVSVGHVVKVVSCCYGLRTVAFFFQMELPRPADGLQH